MKPHKHKLTQIPNTPKGTFFPQTPTKKKVYYLLTLTLDKTLPSNSFSLSLSHTSKVQNTHQKFKTTPSLLQCFLHLVDKELIHILLNKEYIFFFELRKLK